MKITEMTVAALSKALGEREISAKEVTEAYLREIDRQEETIKAYLTVTETEAMKTASHVDILRAKGENLSPLAGIPISVKDNICTRGIPTTCGSRMLEHFCPSYNATVVERLKEKGMVLLGKTNMDEFAMGSSTEHSAYQVTRNPLDTRRVPGGSSGGAAASVAAGEAACALGSDTGGSIRQPASFCGVVGMKPTYGRVSRYGLVAFASSLDQIGPLTRTVEDNALILSALVGQDKRDSTSIPGSVESLSADLGRELYGISVAIPTQCLGEGISSAVKESMRSAAKKLEELGARVEEISMESLKLALPAYYILSSAEASSNLARFDGVKYGFRAENYNSVDELYENTRSQGFGTEVKRRILWGTFVLSEGYYEKYYEKAKRAQVLIKEEYSQIFQRFDLMLTPVTPTSAYRLGEKKQDPLSMYLGDIYTVGVNLAGLPALALPWGKDQDSLPVGIQLVGPTFSEKKLYQVAYAMEQWGKGED